MADPYITAAELKQYTGLTYSDLSFDDDPAYDAWLDERILELSDAINVYTHEDWAAREDADAEKPVPGIVKLSIFEQGREFLVGAVAARQSATVDVSDWDVDSMTANILSDATEAVLDVIKISVPVGFVPVRSLEQILAGEEIEPA